MRSRLPHTLTTAAAALSVCLAGGAVAQTAAPAGAPPMDFNTLKNRPNLDQTPLGSSGQWSLEKLLALTPDEGLALWSKLAPPSLQEMNGHYMGLGPDATNPAHQKGYAAYMFNERSPRGYWLGKAFHPVDATHGEGYNRWRFPHQKIVRNLRMATFIGPSLIDRKPSYILNYGAFNKTTLTDELRKLDDDIYLGEATVDAGGGKRSKPDFFILIGPTDEWVGPGAKQPS